jgi:RNA polymerase sigma-70 factor (ECF subfamily)
MIRAAGEGSPSDRQEFARRYEPLVRAYFGARWRDTPLLDDLEDAVQDVFIECFKDGGALDRADPSRPSGFRAFLYGITRRIARNNERRRANRRDRQAVTRFDLQAIEAREPTLSRVFDKAWAQSLLQESVERLADRAFSHGPAARRRFDLLRLRVWQAMPIRDIAERWDVDAARLHHDYARARDEFKSALMEVVAFHVPGTSAEVERTCIELLSYLE